MPIPPRTIYNAFACKDFAAGCCSDQDLGVWLAAVFVSRRLCIDQSDRRVVDGLLSSTAPISVVDHATLNKIRLTLDGSADRARPPALSDGASMRAADGLKIWLACIDACTSSDPAVGDAVTDLWTELVRGRPHWLKAFHDSRWQGRIDPTDNFEIYPKRFVPDV